MIPLREGHIFLVKRWPHMTAICLCMSVLGTFQACPQTDHASVLLGRLNDRHAETRRQAAYELGQTKESFAVDRLIESLGDKDSKVRATAAWALGEIKDRR